MIYKSKDGKPIEDSQAAIEMAKMVLAPYAEEDLTSFEAVPVSAEVAEEWLQMPLLKRIPSETRVWIVHVEGNIQAPYTPKGITPPVLNKVNVVIDKMDGLVLGIRSFQPTL